jgi:hypothetical protein
VKRKPTKRPGDAYLKQAQVARQKQNKARYGGQRPIQVQMPQVTWETLPDGSDVPRVAPRPPSGRAQRPLEEAPRVWPSVPLAPLPSQEPEGNEQGRVSLLGALPVLGGSSPAPPVVTPPGYVAFPYEKPPKETEPPQLQSPGEPLCPLLGRACLGPDCLWYEPLHRCSVIALTQTLYSVLADLRKVEFRLREKDPGTTSS